ncbi:hypothetical protein MBLNU13_g02011t1 [Cladosporium sp. NU13]
MGDNGVYGLGALELRLADVDLDLRLSSEVKIATSEKDEPDKVPYTHGLTAKSLHGDGHWKPWVVKSHGYQLILDLDVAPELTHGDNAFAQHVAAQLKQLKAGNKNHNFWSILTPYQIWESLGLCVTSIETRQNNPQAASWIISLDYSQRMIPLEKVSLHKLAPELPYHDVKPPPGVRVIKVEAVHVKMLLRNPPTAKVLKSVSCKKGHVDFGHEDLSFDAESLFSGMDTIDEEQLCPSSDARIDEFDHMRSSTRQSDDSGQHSSKVSIVESSCAYLTPPPSQETREERAQNSSTEPKEHVAHCVSTQTIMTSLETGLRHAMCKTPSGNPQNHTITGNEGFDCLPLVAPALWLPDYHKSLSERAVFLPTISHAIANVSGHSSAGLGLKVKSWQLSHRYPHEGKELFHPGSSLDMSKVQGALSVDLWAAMASGLIKTRTAEQSRPLRDLFEPTNGADGLGDAEPMLDEIDTDYESDTTCDESDFEDLLGATSEADDGSICNLAFSETGDVCSSPWTEAPTDRLPSRWNPEHPSRLGRDFDMFEDSTELHEGDPCGKLGSEYGTDGHSSGTHRDISQYWHGSDLDHDSEVVQFPETACAEPEADDMLLWDPGAFGETSSSGQVEMTITANGLS